MAAPRPTPAQTGEPAVSTAAVRPPLYIAMHERDNVAIVANAGGLEAGATFASCRFSWPAKRKAAC